MSKIGLKSHEELFDNFFRSNEEWHVLCNCPSASSILPINSSSRTTSLPNTLPLEREKQSKLVGVSLSITGPDLPSHRQYHSMVALGFGQAIFGGKEWSGKAIICFYLIFKIYLELR